MTLVASWIGIDTHGPSSAYIVSDSRISWDGGYIYDYGKKVFASKQYPELFGYAGDVLFPSIVLSQIIEMIDSGLLFRDNMTCAEKNKIIYEKLRYSFAKYPTLAGLKAIQIIHISRDTTFERYPQFHHYQMTWSSKTDWECEEKPIPPSSGLLFVLGTGKKEFDENYKLYQDGKNRSTSRNVFHCFITTLDKIKCKACGGAPQLVGIYRRPCTNGNNYGIIYKGKRYYLGMEVPKEAQYDNIEWRNENFELCGGQSKRRLEEADRREDPLRRIITKATP